MKTSLILLFIFLSQPTFAFDFEKLFMPGEVIKGHLKYEDDCKKCHVRNRDLTQKSLCLSCHKKVNKDLKNQQGFHSKNKQAKIADCKSCHTEHKGKNKDIINFDHDQFDHSQTDYKLLGKHQQTACNDCHKPKEKYREAPKQCINCHKKKDVHKNKLGKKCQQCHDTKSWQTSSFDHDKTKFKLRQSHKKVSCSLCHTNQTFSKTPKTCISCHKIKDVHNNKFGSNCKTCHSQKKWKDTQFNHYQETSYKLDGAHTNVSCLACHKKVNFKKNKRKLKKARNCISCHKANDIHKEKNGDKCQSCHETESWLKTSFDHEKTDFKLSGQHKKVSCQSCHQNDLKGKKTETSCISCHLQNDAHETQQGENCSQCHNDQSWLLDDVRFDHDLSEFPLIGQHAVASCESCHLDSLFKDTKKSCVSCHDLDDVHKKTIGTQCKNCHNPNDWLIWSFEHDKTDYKLEGAHQNMPCESCHKKPLDDAKKNKSACIKCHRQDDIHDGGFGEQCQQCHSQDDFQTIEIQTMSTYRFNKTGKYNDE